MSVVILLVSLLGASAGLSDSKRIVGAYGVLLAILVVLQLGLLIYGFSRHDQVDTLLDSAWQTAYDSDPRSLQDIETRLQCCGFASVDDRAVPKDSMKACARSPAFGYKVPCKNQLQQAYSRHEHAVLGVISVIEILQILALVAAVFLYKRIPSDDVLEFGRRSDHSRALLRGMRDEDQGLLNDQGQQQSGAYDEDSRYGTVTTLR
ncbi:hypothetical protein EMPS_07040 [Entomortierella parvispora]|uniref:Tetraspanin Tsp3 n=1 Tax=Entomortierella parvispora TaxID=205924 RepID=A0A9P3HDK5_9FUNG|nr:hypothetical protein EMPS_07040 [Entomortierella parvispora]